MLPQGFWSDAMHVLKHWGSIYCRWGWIHKFTIMPVHDCASAVMCRVCACLLEPAQVCPPPCWRALPRDRWPCADGVPVGGPLVPGLQHEDRIYWDLPHLLCCQGLQGTQPRWVPPSHLRITTDHDLRCTTDCHIRCTTDHFLRYTTDQHLRYTTDHHLRYTTDQHLRYSTDHQLRYTTDHRLRYTTDQHLRYTTDHQLRYTTDQHLRYTTDQHLRYAQIIASDNWILPIHNRSPTKICNWSPSFRLIFSRYPFLSCPVLYVFCVISIPLLLLLFHMSSAPTDAWMDQFPVRFLGSVQVPVHQGNHVLCAAMQKVHCRQNNLGSKINIFWRQGRTGSSLRVLQH